MLDRLNANSCKIGKTSSLVLRGSAAVTSGGQRGSRREKRPDTEASV